MGWVASPTTMPYMMTRSPGFEIDERELVLGRNILGDGRGDVPDVYCCSSCERHKGDEDVVAGIDLKSSVGHVCIPRRRPAVTICLSKDIAWDARNGYGSDMIEGSRKG